MTAAELTTIRTSLLAALGEVAANGAASLSIGGRSVTFRDPKDILALVNTIDAQIARASAGSGSVLAVRFGAPE